MANPFSNPFGGKGDTESLKKEIERLEHSVKELSVLSELAFAMGAETDPDAIVQTLVDRLMRSLNAEQAVVTMTRSDDEDDDPMKTSVRVKDTSAGTTAFHFTDALLGWMYNYKKPLIINDPAGDERFKRVEFDPSIRSLACVPMLIKNEMSGVITVYNKKDEAGFSDDDQRLLSILGAQSAHLIENARLAKETAMLAQIQAQQRAAIQIQQNLLPDENPTVDGYDIAGASTPAQDVGGDTYDFIPAPNGRWGICLGDVSGKGVPAALLMANVQATLRAQTLSDVSVKERIERANVHMDESTGVENFVTVFYSVLDPIEHTMSFCCAGHDPPLFYCGGGEPREIQSSGPALGVISPFEYEEEMLNFASGDMLVIYSDGVTDAINGAGDMFGFDRLKAVIHEHKALPAAELVQTLFDTVNAFVGKAPQFDDLTAVVVKRR